MTRSIRIGIIAGSGVGEAIADGLSTRKRRSHNPATPFGRTSSPVLVGERDGVSLALLQRHGIGHAINPSRVPSRANIFALKSLGCTHILATGAVGSLREHILPGDLVLCDQLIDRTVDRPRTFFDDAAVHVEFAEPFCPVTRDWLLAAAEPLTGVRVHDRGCYVCMEGPAFSTRAESHMHRQWGGDVIGMTALPEARLAREAEMAYALIALPTDFDCWKPRSQDRADQNSLLAEILSNLRQATSACIELLTHALRDIAMIAQSPSPAHDALRLAIWSDKSSIDARTIRRLAPIWGSRLGRSSSGSPLRKKRR